MILSKRNLLYLQLDSATQFVAIGYGPTREEMNCELPGGHNIPKLIMFSSHVISVAYPDYLSRLSCGQFYHLTKLMRFNFLTEMDQKNSSY